jgi:26S proteasome regulatory subunit N1
MARTAEILVETCSYAGTGNVLKVQKMLHICSERLVKPEKEENADQAEAEAEEEEVAPEAEGEGPAAPATPAAAASSSAPRVPGAATATAPGAAADAATAEPTETAEETEAKAKAKDVGLKFQSVAVIGIALIAMGEEVGSEMALRHFQHLVSGLSSLVLHYPPNIPLWSLQSGRTAMV